MKPIQYLIPATLVATLTTSLVAQGDERPGGRDHPPMPPIIRVLDRDEDGVISKREIARSPRSLARLDSNHDDELTSEELRPPRPPREEDSERRRPRRGERNEEGEEGGQGEGERGPRRGPPPSPILSALDADHDGVISEDEIDDAPEALAGLDANDDGELTPDELRPPRADGPPPHDDGPPAGQEDDNDRRPAPPRRGPRGSESPDDKP